VKKKKKKIAKIKRKKEKSKIDTNVELKADTKTDMKPEIKADTKTEVKTTITDNKPIVVAVPKNEALENSIETKAINSQIEEKKEVKEQKELEAPKPTEMSKEQVTPKPEESADYVHIYTIQELLQHFEKLRGTKPTITVGMVGYPNVGKSSTINALYGEKKVRVAATPGKTKHLQTIVLSTEMTLCDCPGLVFPSFTNTKAELVVNGILPIDELRDHVGPTTLVCERIPREILEKVYGIKLPLRTFQGKPLPPTSEELLLAYAGSRGFMNVRGSPDEPRGARYILKDYVAGKLLFCFEPPVKTTVELEQQAVQDKITLTKILADPVNYQDSADIDDLNNIPLVPDTTNSTSKKARTQRIPDPEATSTKRHYKKFKKQQIRVQPNANFDQDFFKLQSNVRAHTMGTLGKSLVNDFSRAEFINKS